MAWWSPHCSLLSNPYIYIYVIEADLAHISYSNRNLCPLQILSYALGISLSIMELQWPEFLITCAFF